MKNAICFFFCFIMLGSTVFAQSRFNLIGGMNLASLKVEEALETTVINSESRAGLTGGVGFDLSLGGELAYLSLNLLYTEKGASIIESGVRGTWEANFGEAQLLLKMGNHVFVEGGLGVGKILEANIVNPSGKKQDVSALMKEVSGGFLLGGGFRLGPVILDARYAVNFTPAFNKPAPQDVTQKGLMLMAGLSFPLD